MIIQNVTTCTAATTNHVNEFFSCFLRRSNDFYTLFEELLHLQPIFRRLILNLRALKNFINIIMAVYIAFITCYPCSDKDICVDEDSTAQHELIIKAQEDSHQNLDLCSPFCICNCCHSTINQPKFLSLVFPSLKMHEFNAVITFHNVQAIFYSIWQPPKLS